MTNKDSFEEFLKRQKARQQPTQREAEIICARIARGEIKSLWIGGCEIVPHTELKRLGLELEK